MRIKIDHSKKINDVLILRNEKQSTLYSEKLVAKSVNQEEEKSFIEQCSRLFSEPENVKLFGEGAVWNVKQVTEFVHREMAQWNLGKKLGAFAVYTQDTQEFMGLLFVNHALDEFARIGKGHANVAEIGYILDQKFWGKGYGTSIAILGKKYIKDVVATAAEDNTEYHIKEIVATVHPANTGSKRILEKTLKHQEEEEFIRFNGKLRLLFFKPFEPVRTRSEVDLNMTLSKL